MTAHIPAWKRLGLKLKYAKEQSDRAPTAVNANTHDRDLGTPERPSKRRRIGKDDPVASSQQENARSSSDVSLHHTETSKADVTNGSSHPSKTSTPRPKRTIQRKKSVTFSEETKQEDGDSRTTIDFPAGSPGSTPKKTNESSGSDPVESPITANRGMTKDGTTPTKRQPKAETGKKSKSSKASTKDKSSSALGYLNQHRGDRESWKFNKILDVWILNHALDVQAITSSHVPSLAGYVRGLSVKAGSRDRLIKECREALSSSQLDGDVDEQDRELFIKAVESRTGPLEEASRLEDFLQAHSRPAVLLWALDETVGAPASSSSTTQSALAVRKKKSRTSAQIDISSSESDSDSDSSDDSSDSSDSDGEDNLTRKTTNPVATEHSNNDNDTSSSGSSSSEDEDSTSDSDSSSSNEDNSSSGE